MIGLDANSWLLAEPGGRVSGLHKALFRASDGRPVGMAQAQATGNEQKFKQKP
jgi:hypothetical protein